MELRIEQLPISALKADSGNARRHAKRDVDSIAASITEFGFSDPIGIWGPDNLVVEGHGRLMAAQQLGLESVPVIRLDHLSEEQRRAYALAHNRTAELSAWDSELVDASLLDIPTIDMTAFGFTMPEPPKPLELDGPAQKRDAEKGKISHVCRCPKCGFEFPL